MAIKTFTSGEILTAADTNTYLANSGLVVIKSVTVGSTVATVPVTDIFSSTYNSYRIVYSDGVSSASGATAHMRMTLSGLTGSNYFSQGQQQTSGSATPAYIGFSSQTYWWVSSINPNSFGFSIDIHNPNVSKFTYFRSDFASDYSAGWTGGLINVTTATTGVTFLPDSGTLSGGTITVYGYRLG
jgi:hypothetical protein